MGIRYFDTAPLYGHGLAERELGRFVQGRRSGLTLVTKFGILPTPWLAAVPALALPLLGARAALARLGWIGEPARDYGVAELRCSVDRSLVNLRTDYIDILMLHEPSLAMLSEPAALDEALADLRAAGKIRYAGISGSAEACLEIAAQCPAAADVFQVDATQAGVLQALRAAGREVQVSFGHLRGQARAAGPEGCIAEALRFNRTGAILFASTKLEHIREVVELIERLDALPMEAAP